MSKALPLDVMTDAVHDGIVQAFRTYKKWSGGYWLNEAPESFIAYHIGKTLQKQGAVVTLESTVRDILRYSGGSKKGRTPGGAPKGRFDVVAWNKRDSPRALVEVKKPRKKTGGSTKSDAHRMWLMLRKTDSSVKHGLIGIYLMRKSEDALDAFLAALADDSRTKVVRRTDHPSKDGEDRIWCAAVLQVQKG